MVVHCTGPNVFILYSLTLAINDRIIEYKQKNELILMNCNFLFSSFNVVRLLDKQEVKDSDLNYKPLSRQSNNIMDTNSFSIVENSLIVNSHILAESSFKS